MQEKEEEGDPGWRRRAWWTRKEGRHFLALEGKSKQFNSAFQISLQGNRSQSNTEGYFTHFYGISMSLLAALTRSFSDSFCDLFSRVHVNAQECSVWDVTDAGVSGPNITMNSAAEALHKSSLSFLSLLLVTVINSRLNLNVKNRKRTSKSLLTDCKKKKVNFSCPECSWVCVCARVCKSSVWCKSGPLVSLWAMLRFDVEFDDWSCLISDYV